MTTAEIITPVLTKEELIIRVEHLVKNDDLTYLESIMHLCEELDLDPEDVAKMITGPLKDKLENESQRRHTIRSDYNNTSTLFDD